MVNSKEKLKQADSSLSARDRLIVPLDFRTKEEAFKLVEELGNRVGFYKIGYELFVAQGPQFVREFISLTGKKVFLDLKMNDIGETIERAVESIASMGVEFLTLHGNGATAQSAQRGRDLAKSQTPRFLQVTYLSSLDQTDLKDIFGSDNVNIQDFIRYRAEQVLRVGCDGLIASGESVADLRQYLDGRVPPPIIVVPGIRPAWSGKDDHKRTLTPSDAIHAGADYLVVGRPIRNASDRSVAAQRVIDEIEEALS
jgi:orotidine-5'-phosphate decarboxylase